MAKNNKTMSRMRNFLKYYFFKETNNYETKNCGDYILEHRWNGNIKEWEVAIFTKESFKVMKVGQEKFYGQSNLSLDDLGLQEQHFNNI